MISNSHHRPLWIGALERVALPVYENLARHELKKRMPVEARPGHADSRKLFSHLEALGRSFAGIAPWLALQGLGGEEEAKRSNLRSLALQAISNAVDPDSADCLDFRAGGQVVVDTAFLAQGLLRAGSAFWQELGPQTQANIVRSFKQTRVFKPGFNNWLLFSATTETFLASIGEEWDPMRVDYAIRQHDQWYKGDGVYGDGPRFHCDYYNSFVIHPMLVDVLNSISRVTTEWEAFKEPVIRRAQRYAAVQERQIASDGSFPPIGRSLAYRFGAFQALSQVALLDLLPPEIAPAQVRCALTAAIERGLSAPDTFDDQGWLRIGLCGSQPSIGETYISTGSLYLCLFVMLPLGLSPEHPFWSAPDADWTWKKVWTGQDVICDHALHD